MQVPTTNYASMIIINLVGMNIYFIALVFYNIELLTIFWFWQSGTDFEKANLSFQFGHRFGH